MRKLDFFWKSNEDWFDRLESGACVIRPDAPPEAQESYKHYQEQCKRIAARSDKYLD